jgi:hypothetical protein
VYAVFIGVLVLLGLVFLYGALLAVSSPRALLDPKDAGLVRLIPTSATVENIEYRWDGPDKCRTTRPGRTSPESDITFRFVSNDGKFIKVRKFMCWHDIPGWGFSSVVPGLEEFSKERSLLVPLREGEEVPLWYDPADPSQISWPRRYSPSLMFTGLTLMVAPVVLGVWFVRTLRRAVARSKELTESLRGKL